jgi:hypothetical protein
MESHSVQGQMDAIVETRFVDDQLWQHVSALFVHRDNHSWIVAVLLTVCPLSMFSSYFCVMHASENAK